jgi:hypothetical protein
MFIVVFICPCQCAHFVPVSISVPIAVPGSVSVPVSAVRARVCDCASGGICASASVCACVSACVCFVVGGVFQPCWRDHFSCDVIVLRGVVIGDLLYEYPRRKSG